MYLSIGDVVEITSDHTLGRVTGVANHTSGNLVEVSTAPGVRRTVRPTALTRVADARVTMTKGRAWATIVIAVLGMAGGILLGLQVADLHGPLALMVFVGLTGTATINGALSKMFLGSRKIRV